MANNSELCRACLTRETSFTYMLFENVSPDIYTFCTSVEILQDELPKSLCDTCYNHLTKYAEFKRTCIQSENTLLGYKNSMKYERLDESSNNGGSQSLDDFDEKLNEVANIPVKVEPEHDISDADLPDEPLINMTVKVHKKKTKKLTKFKHHLQKESKPKVASKKFIYICDQCPRKFNYPDRFEAHKQEHEGKIVSIKCSPCNKTFSTWSGLNRHKVIEHTLVSLESLKCKTCGKIFKSRQTLQMHAKMHGERRLNVCDVCGKGYSTVGILKAHLETHQENRERRFTCEHCGKKFYTNTILSAHVSRRHTGRRYICQICSYPFTTKYNLAKHLLIHDGKKLHKCDICDKSIATHSSLLEHKRIHSGERPYVCSFCPKAFVSKKRLTDHVRIHTGVKPYQCTVCDQRFTQRGTMKRHMKVHDRLLPTS